MTDKACMIGGVHCHAEVGPRLLPREDQELTPREREQLWRIFQEIGRTWDDLREGGKDSSTLKSSWLEFVQAKTKYEPSYVAEYSNAVSVVDELIAMYGDGEAFEKLFLDHHIPDGPPSTRLGHAKKYVVDEFIRVNAVASGFRSFGRPDHHGRNYKGYIGGSRYNLKAKVRAFVDPEGDGD